MAPQKIVTDLHVNMNGSLTLQLQLGKKLDLHVSTRDEARLHSGNSIVTPRSMSALERKLELEATVPDEDLGPSTDWRGIPRGPSQLAWRLDFPEAPRAGP